MTQSNPQSIKEYVKNKVNRDTDKQHMLCRDQQVLADTQAIHLINLTPLALNFDKSISLGKTSIYVEGRLIGEIEKNADQITLNILVDTPINLTGSIEMNNVTIKSLGKIALNADIKANGSLTIDCDDLNIQKNLVSKRIDITAQRDVNSSVNIESRDLKVSGSNIYLQGKINSDFLELNATQLLETEANIYTDQFAALNGSTVNNSGKIHGDIVTITGSQNVVNQGEISATTALKFRTSTLDDFGKIESKGKLKLYCQHVNAAEKSHISAKTSFKLVGNDFNNAGQMSLNGAAFFSIANFTNSGNIKIPEQSYLHAQNFHLSGYGKMTNYAPKPNDVIKAPPQKLSCKIEVDNQIIIQQNADLKLIGSQLVTSDLKIMGNLDLNYALSTTKNASIQGHFQSNNGKIITNNTISTQENGKLSLTNAELLANEVHASGVGGMQTSSSTITANKMHSDADINSLKTRFIIADEIISNKKLHTTECLIQVKQQKLAGEAKFSHSYLDIKQDVNAKDCALSFSDSTVVKARVIATEGNSTLNVQQANIASVSLKTQGYIDVADSKINSKFLAQKGKGKFENSVVTIGARLTQEPNASLIIKHAQVTAASASIDGSTQVNDKSQMIIDNIDIRGKFSLNESFCQAKLITSDETSELIGENKSFWEVEDSLQIHGKSTFDSNSIEVNRLSNNGDMAIKQSRVVVKDVMRSTSKINIDGAEVKTNSISLAGNFDVKRSVFDTKSLNEQGNGAFTDSALTTTFLNVTEQAGAKFSNTSMTTQFAHFTGDIILNGSEINADVIDQVKGKLSATKSNLTVKDAVSNGLTAKFSLNDSSHLNSKKETENALVGNFEGEFSSDKSKVSLLNLQLNDNADFNNSQIEVDKNLALVGSNNTIKNSSLNARDINLSQKTDLNRSKISAKNLSTADNSRTIADDSFLDIKNSLDLFGNFDIARSQIIAKDLEIYTQFKSEKSKVTVAKNLKINNKGDAVFNASEVTAKKLNVFNKMSATESKITAKDDFNINHGASLKVNKVALEVGNKFYVAHHSTVSGENCSIKSDSLSNSGDISVDGLKIDTEVLDNAGGSIDGGKKLDIDANKALFNMMGSIRADTTNITSSFAFNCFGDICGNDSLTMNSLVNLNTFGTYRSYNLNVNSLIDLNYGLALPALPTSLDSVFSTNHLINFSRIALTNIFPKFSSAINLAYQVTPLAIKTGKFIYDSVKTLRDKDKSYRDLLPSFDIHNYKMKDILPTILAAKGLFMSGMSIYNSSTKLATEFENFTFENLSKQLDQTPESSLLSLVGTAFGPTLVRDSFLSMNGGVNASLNVMQNDWFSANTGMSVGAQSYSHNTHTMWNQGVLYGSQVNLIGNNLTNSGWIANESKMYIKFNDIKNNWGGTIDGTNAFIKADTFTNNADLRVADNSRIETQVFENKNTGNVSVSKQSVLDTTKFTTAGSVAISQSHLGVKEKIHVEQGGKLDAQNSTTKAAGLEVTGAAQFKHDKTENHTQDRTSSDTPQADQQGQQQTLTKDLELDSKINVHQGGSLILDGVSVKAEGIDNQGNAAINQAKLDLAQDIFVQKTGSLSMQETATKARGLIVEGSADISNKPKPEINAANPNNDPNENTAGGANENVAPKDLELSSKIEVREGGKLSINNISLHADGIENAGNLQINKGSVQLDHDLHVAASGHNSIKNATTKTENVVVDGYAEFKNDKKEAPKQESASDAPVENATQDTKSLNADLDVRENIKVNKGGVVVYDNVAVNSNNTHYQGTANYKDSVHNTRATLHVDKNSELQATGSSLAAKNIKLEGKEAFNESAIKAAENIMVSDDNNLTANKTTMEGKNLELAGAVKLDQTLIKMQEQAKIAETANLEAKNAAIKANEIINEGKTTYSEFFGLEANRLVNAEKSEIKTAEKNGQNLLELKAQEAKLKGKVDVDHVSLQVNKIDGAEDLIARKGKYSNFFVSDSLHFKTDQKINLDQTINRSCGLDIEAASINFRVDYQTSHNLHFKSTSGDIGLYSNLTAKNIYAESADNLYTSRNVHAQDVIRIEAKNTYANLAGHVAANIISIEAGAIKNYHVNSKALAKLDPQYRKAAGQSGVIHGNQVYLEATQSNIENYGGILKGNNYLQAIAKNDIINQCNIQQRRGKHDTVKQFDPAIISGGEGLDENHIGLYLQADNKIYNYGSTIESSGNNYISAKNGFISEALSHTYISKHKKERKWYGKKKEKTETATVVGSSNVLAANGRNIIMVENGSINCIATNFISRDGTQAYAKGNIELYSLKYTDKKSKKSEQLWGLSKSKHKESHEQAVPVLIFDHGVTRLESAEGSIIGRGVVALGNGDFITVAKKGSILFSADTLEHHISDKKSGFSVSCPGLQSANSLLHGGLQGFVNNLDPTIAKMNSLLNSQNGAEFAANGWNASLSAYNSYQIFANSNFSNVMLDRLGVNALLNPSLDLTYSTSELNISYQTAGPGMIQRANWQIEAGDKVRIEGVNVDIAENMSVKAKVFELSGHKLDSSMSYEHKSLSVGVTPTGEVVHASASYSKATNEATHYENQHLHVGKNLHVEVENMSLNAANIDTGTLTGKVDHLHIKSQQDTFSNASISANLSSTGNVAFNQSNDEGAKINQASGIHAREGINHDAEHSFEVKTTVMEGAKITSDGVNNFKSDIIVNKDIHDYEKHRTVGVAVNVNDLANIISPPDTNAQLPAVDNQTPKTINVMSVTQNKSDYKATQHATFFGQKGTNVQAKTVVGNMHTMDASGYEVVVDKQQNITVDVPLINPKTLLPKKETKLDNTQVQQPQLKEGEEGTTEPVTESPDENIEETAIKADGDHQIETVSPDENNPETTDQKNENTTSNSEFVSNENQPVTNTQQEACDNQQSTDPNLSPIEQFCVDAGFTALGIKYEEIEAAVNRMGATGVSKIFKGLGLGVNFSAILMEEQQNGNQSPLATAFLRTIIEAPTMLISWRVLLPLKMLAGGTRGFTDDLDQHPEKFTNSEMWQKYGDSEEFRCLHPELFEREGLLESYGLAKAIQFVADIPSAVSRYTAHEFIQWKNSSTFFGGSTPREVPLPPPPPATTATPQNQ